MDGLLALPLRSQGFAISVEAIAKFSMQLASTTVTMVAAGAVHWSLELHTTSGSARQATR